MLERLDTQTITISPAASQAVQNILTERKLEGYALRIFVAGGGCCSTQFGMSLDNHIRDVDTTIELDDVKVVVDEVSLDYLRGASIDFVNDPHHGAGFVINSPSAHIHEGEACNCGGSCNCNN